MYKHKGGVRVITTWTGSVLAGTGMPAMAAPIPTGGLNTAPLL